MGLLINFIIVYVRYDAPLNYTAFCLFFINVVRPLEFIRNIMAYVDLSMQLEEDSLVLHKDSHDGKWISSSLDLGSYSIKLFNLYYIIYM
jgi:hypothetical protein